MKCSFGIYNFLEEISSPSHSIVFLYFFTCVCVCVCALSHSVMSSSWDPMDCSLPESFLSMVFSNQEYWRNGYHFLLQGTFRTQELNPHPRVSYIDGSFFTTSLFLCTIHLRRSYFSLLFSGILNSAECIFPLSFVFYISSYVSFL